MRLFCASLLLLSLTLGHAVPATPEQLEFFENKIRPLFAERCYACHSQKAQKVKGGLKLDTPEDVRKGGSSGAAIVLSSSSSNQSSYRESGWWRTKLRKCKSVMTGNCPDQ